VEGLQIPDGTLSFMGKVEDKAAENRENGRELL
jgi:hypothetical protein